MEEQLLYETLLCLRSHELVRVTLNFGVTPVQFSWREICAFFIVLNILPSYFNVEFIYDFKDFNIKKKSEKRNKKQNLLFIIMNSCVIEKPKKFRCDFT